jgi:hypothetical protein
VIDGHTVRQGGPRASEGREYDDAAAVAAATGRPLRDVLAEAPRSPNGTSSDPTVRRHRLRHAHRSGAGRRAVVPRCRDGAPHSKPHIPGAVWVDLDHQLAATEHTDTDGRHPFGTAAFAAAMGSLGIANDTLVVAYDDTGGLTAGRLAMLQ